MTTVESIREIACPNAECGGTDNLWTFERTVLFQRVDGYDAEEGDFEYGDIDNGHMGDTVSLANHKGERMLVCRDCDTIFPFGTPLSNTSGPSAVFDIYNGRDLPAGEAIPASLSTSNEFGYS